MSTPATPKAVKLPGVPDARTRKLFPKEWLEIVNLAQSGVKVADVAKTYSVDDSVIYRGLKKRGVNVTAVASRLAMEEADKHKAELLRKIRETKDKDYRFTEFLQQQIISTIVDAQKKAIGIGTRLDDIKALKIAMDGVKNGTENKWRILGLDRENADSDAALPELPIRDLTDEEVNVMRNRQEEEDGGTAIDPDLLADIEEPPDDVLEE